MRGAYDLHVRGKHAQVIRHEFKLVYIRYEYSVEEVDK